MKIMIKYKTLSFLFIKKFYAYNKKGNFMIRNVSKFSSHKPMIIIFKTLEYVYVLLN